MRKHLYPIMVALALVATACSKEKEAEIPVTKVKNETFYIDLHEEGEIEAINSINISSPVISWRYGSLKVIQIIEDGTEVEEGDTLVAFDPSEVQKAIVDAESKLEIHYAELERLKAQQQSDLEELRADLEITKLSQQISKIQFESSEYEADIKKKEIQLTLEKANIALDQAAEEIENKKKIQKEEITQKMLSIRQAKSELDDSYNTLERLTVVAPSPGIAIIRKNWSSDAKFQIADQVWSGQEMIDLPDLNAMQADVYINEVDISKIKLGLKVQIRPDAFSDSIYTGEVMTVANLAVNKDNNSQIKVFPIEIKINGGKNKLMPGLTVSCRIIMDEIPNATFIPLDALFREGAHDYVYLKTMSGFKKQEIVTGVSNADYIIVEDGIEPGDVVALTNPFVSEEGKSEDPKK